MTQPDFPPPIVEDPELIDAVTRFRQRAEELSDNGMDLDDKVVMFTHIMRLADDVADWAAAMREDAVYRLFYDAERDASMSSVARRAGVTPQALTRVLAIARSKRAGTEDEEF